MANLNGVSAQPESLIPTSLDAQSVLGVLEKLWTAIVGGHPITLTNAVLIVWLIIGLIRVSGSALEWINKALAQWAIFADSWGLRSGEKGPERLERQHICDVLNHRIVSLNHAEGFVKLTAANYLFG